MKFRVNKLQNSKFSKKYALTNALGILSQSKYYAVHEEITICFNKIEKCILKHEFSESDNSHIYLDEVQSNRYEYYFKPNKQSKIGKLNQLLLNISESKLGKVYLNVRQLFDRYSYKTDWIIDISKHFQNIPVVIRGMPNDAIHYLLFVDPDYSKYNNVEFIWEKEENPLFLTQIDKIVEISEGEFKPKLTFKNTTVF